MKKTIKLTIPMRIFPKRRPRQGAQGQFYTPTDEREKNLKDYFFQFRAEKKLKVIEYCISLHCLFYVKGKAGMDLDNALKSILDCGEGILWENDRQIKASSEAFIENAGKDSIDIIFEKLAND